MGSRFRRFHWQVAGRPVLISLTLAASALLFVRMGFHWLPALLAILTIIQISLLFRYIHREIGKLTRFLQIIRYSDFSLSCKVEHLGPAFHDLQEEFTAIIEQFRQQRTEKEEQHNYLQSVIQQVGIGIVSFQPDGRVDLCNRAARRQLRLSHLRHLDSLPVHLQPLGETMRKLGAGEKKLFKMVHDGEVIQLSLFSQQLKIGPRFYTIVSLQNIHEELEEIESEAWQSLIRVLTHEMMNSMTPIASLSGSAAGLLEDTDDSVPSAETLEDLRRALATINSRSHGLMKFIQAYRHLTLIPSPRFVVVPVSELFRRVEVLFQAEASCTDSKPEWRVDPESLELTADPDLVEQVLINLVLNSRDAVAAAKDGWIHLSASLNDQGRVVIQVTDNGCGIPPDMMDKIFIPFFSTKDGGSGIGLSFSRQVMRLHHGNLTAQSEPGLTRFTLRF